MTTPKPAPSKPLTFTPPIYLKGETQSSELPVVEGAEPNVIAKRATKYKKPQNRRADIPEAKVTGERKGLRPNITIIDEIYDANGNVELVLGLSDTTKKEAEKPKKPFVLDPRLTQRPFHDDRLMQLKTRLQRPSFKNR